MSPIWYLYKMQVSNSIYPQNQHQNLFAKGLASPTDLDEWGITPLRVSRWQLSKRTSRVLESCLILYAIIGFLTNFFDKDGILLQCVESVRVLAQCRSRFSARRFPMQNASYTTFGLFWC